MTRGVISRTFTYYANQLPYTVVDPEAGTRTYAYDPAGNIATVNHNGVYTETRAYDTANRLTGITYSNGDPTVALGWYKNGLPRSSSRGGVSHSYTYDGTRFLIADVTNIAGTAYTVQYGHDGYGHRSSITYPDGKLVSFGPDAYGRPTVVGNYPTVTGSYALQVFYYANGALDRFTYGNSILHKTIQCNRQLPCRSYDAAQSATPIFDWSISYDGNANPSSISDNVSPYKNSKSFSYDSANRLHTANAINLWNGANFNYDTQDNLTSEVIGGQTSTFTIDSANRLSALNGTAITYDGLGNVAQIGTPSPLSSSGGYGYAFGAGHLLNQITDGTNTNAFTYDASGLQAQSVFNNGITNQRTTTAKVYDTEGRLINEAATRLPISSTTTTRYFYLGSHLIATDQDTGSGFVTTYVHTDPLGSPLAGTTTTQTVSPVWTKTYLPFGGHYGDTGSGSAGAIDYAGQQTAMGGLVYMRARYYSPLLHRFISPDPDGISAGSALNFNRYSYASNSPYANYDPSGRFTDPAGAADAPPPRQHPDDAMYNFIKKIGIVTWNDIGALQVHAETGGRPPYGAMFRLGTLGMGVAGTAADAISVLDASITSVGRLGSSVATQDIYVIGRYDDVLPFVGQPGYQTNVGISNWTPAQNFGWVQQGVNDNASFQFASPLTEYNLYNGGAYNDGFTGFGVEASQLIYADYTINDGSATPPISD